MKMTDAYEYQSFYNEISDLHMLDCRDLTGTRCYLDEEAKATLLSRMANLPVHGLHFIDSGNYHYLSLLWLTGIAQDFALVLFDHHPDNQPPGFGDITSCGGWVLEATETLPHLKAVYTYGVGSELPIGSIPTDLPIYISIDKDILAPAYSSTDWDQGDMTLEELLSMLGALLTLHQIIGIDICGDASTDPEANACLNNQINLTIFDFIQQNL